jgi:hypothetical protein
LETAALALKLAPGLDVEAPRTLIETIGNETSDVAKEGLDVEAPRTLIETMGNETSDVAQEGFGCGVPSSYKTVISNAVIAVGGAYLRYSSGTWSLGSSSAGATRFSFVS